MWLHWVINKADFFYWFLHFCGWALFIIETNFCCVVYQNGLTALGMAVAKQNLAAAECILRHQPLASPCNIMAVLSTQNDHEEAPTLSKVMGAVEWACNSNPIATGTPRKKGRRACVITWNWNGKIQKVLVWMCGLSSLSGLKRKWIQLSVDSCNRHFEW
jgi:hypothetical protein